MQTRRFFLRSTLATAALAGGTRLARAAFAQSAAQATQFINQTARQMIAVIDSPASQAAKSAQLQQIVNRAVAVDEIARFCLGRYWRSATPAQQQEYAQLFHRVLLNSITGHLGDYKGITYTLGRAIPGDGGVQVPSVLTRPGQPTANLTWVVANDGAGSPKIIDVLAEGTSMRVTQRSDYGGFLDSHGGNVGALVDALKRQARQQS